MFPTPYGDDDFPLRSASSLAIRAFVLLTLTLACRVAAALALLIAEMALTALAIATNGAARASAIGRSVCIKPMILPTPVRTLPILSYQSLVCPMILVTTSLILPCFPLDRKSVV